MSLIILWLFLCISSSNLVSFREFDTVGHLKHSFRDNLLKYIMILAVLFLHLKENEKVRISPLDDTRKPNFLHYISDDMTCHYDHNILVKKKKIKSFVKKYIYNLCYESFHSLIIFIS